MIFALILVLGSGPTSTVTRVGSYNNVSECNQRATEMYRMLSGRGFAFCLPVDH